MKAASLIHGAHLLSVRQHQSVVDLPIQKQQPVAFDIDVGQNKETCPDVAKRLEAAERKAITMD